MRRTCYVSRFYGSSKSSIKKETRRREKEREREREREREKGLNSSVHKRRPEYCDVFTIEGQQNDGGNTLQIIYNRWYLYSIIYWSNHSFVIYVFLSLSIFSWFISSNFFAMSSSTDPPDLTSSANPVGMLKGHDDNANIHITRVSLSR